MTRRRWSVAVALAAGLSAGCTYRNAMWSAKGHANEARQLEQHGQSSEARAQWAQAAARTKAWRTDDALVLRAEGLAYSDACRDAAVVIAGARAVVHDDARRERLDLADADCALAGAEPSHADSALAAPLVSKNPTRRSRAEFLAGRTAALRLDYDAAATHFKRSAEPGAMGRALVTEQRARLVRARQRGDLLPIATELARLLRTEKGTEDASGLVELLATVSVIAETPATRFRAAEIVRDSLHAPALAGQLFLDAVAVDSTSLYAPKALIAALTLLPERRDSLVAILDSRYAASPYTRVFHGQPSVAYAMAEDSLARTLGVQSEGTGRNGASGVITDAPVPGRRGPRLE